uniref:hypothetical protein n=1 Tax=Micromonospora sp. AKA109 TaxID=2733865 RepID=UPI002493AA55|nr:hypothetical protein [Micromonospora sp. AKA109]
MAADPITVVSGAAAEPAGETPPVAEQRGQHAGEPGRRPAMNSRGTPPTAA